MDYDETKYVNVSKLDVKDFTKLLEQTKGEVYLIDDKDNKINLKSKLSQLIGLSNIIEAGKISNAKFYFKDPVTGIRPAPRHNKGGRRSGYSGRNG